MEINKERKNTVIREIKDETGSTTRDSKSLSNLFNEFFTDIRVKLANRILKRDLSKSI